MAPMIAGIATSINDIFIPPVPGTIWRRVSAGSCRFARASYPRKSGRIAGLQQEAEFRQSIDCDQSLGLPYFRAERILRAGAEGQTRYDGLMATASRQIPTIILMRHEATAPEPSRGGQQTAAPGRP